MKKALIFLAMTSLVLVQGSAEGASLQAELIMSGGRSWKGTLVKRDGDFVVFSKQNSANPIRMGASAIKELMFEVEIDAEKLFEMKNNREFERVINSLVKVLEPYKEYSDIPSNLTKYNTLLMEMYYRAGAYKESLAISSKIADDSRSPELQHKSRIYKILALIDGKRADDAKALLAEYGWDQDVSNNAEPEKLYLNAKLLTLNKEYSKAMALVAKVVAFNSQDPDWMQPSELLCAQLYTELGMLDSADEVIRQISMLYKNTPENDTAQDLKIRIEAKRAELLIENNVNTDEA